MLPVTALLSGWGLMTIYRLLPGFGLRQSVWLAVAAGVLIAGLRLPANLGYLRKHKYLLLVGGLTLTALTIIFGTNPLGNGPRMWLGCCGIYLQPSEPLKLLLVIYLAAFLADLQVSMIIRNDSNRSGTKSPPGSVFTLLAPTLVMLSLALILLLAQRDLGTASIFLFLYTAMLFLSTGHKRILVIGAILIGIAGIAGYAAFDLVRVRFEGWLNPWLDPSGHSYQIVQSILAIANGGVFGRGPGLGNPGLVPIPHSDFIFAAIAEESGLAGVIALVILIGILAGRGITIALNSQDHFRRLLAAGLTAFIVGQSILIAGGNVRLLPLTGVTLPLVSYGGSSLVTSFVAVLLLLQISSLKANKPVPLSISRIYLFFGGLLFAGLVAVALVTGWWAVFRSPGLLTRTDNARRTISDRDVRRGALVDKREQPINQSLGGPGSYSRSTSYPDLSAFVGYTNPTFGQSGLEAALDPYLRGTQGNSDWLVWWNHLLYGEPPPGLDVRLSLDLAIQQKADALLNQHPGALVLLNANTGEVLAVSTRPTFDANHLEANWQDLIADPETPLVNRATQGSYPPGAAVAPFLLAQSESGQAQLPELPPEEQKVTCAQSPINRTWSEMIRSGCAESLTRLMDILGDAQSQQLFARLGLIAPNQSIASAVSPTRAVVSSGPGNLSVSPLEMALAAASISSGGKRPALRTCFSRKYS